MVKCIINTCDDEIDLCFFIISALDDAYNLR